MRSPHPSFHPACRRVLSLSPSPLSATAGAGWTTTSAAAALRQVPRTSPVSSPATSTTRHYLPRTAGSLSAGPTLISLAAPLRLGPSAQIFCSFPHSRSGSVPRIGSSARRRLPLGGVQRRRGSPRLGGGVGGFPHLLSPVASRPRLRPPRTGRRPCVRTSLSPPASSVPVGARPAAQGGRALAPPVAVPYYNS